MPDMKRGQRESLRKHCAELLFDVEIYHKARMDLEVYCIGLDAAGRFSSDQYVMAHSHAYTPENTENDRVAFRLTLGQLPPEIAKLIFTVSIRGTQTMHALKEGTFRLLSGQTEAVRYAYSGAEFTAERAIVIAEIYRKDTDWRVSAIGRGFNGGLKALVESYGGTIQMLPTAPGAAPAARQPVTDARSIIEALPQAVSERMDGLARQCRGDTAYLSDLYKNMFLTVTRYPRTTARAVRVVMCADASGSMFDQYHNGRIQRIVDKFFAFATTLSPSCAMDFWAFAAKSRQLDAVKMHNVRDYTFAEAGGFERWMSMLNYQYNNEPEAMRDIMMIYGARREPVMVLFVTDGRIASDWEIEEILIKTSRFPVFWQFIGIHGEEYGVLSRLEQIDGRHTQNAAFMALDDIDEVTDQALFAELLHNLDLWLNTPAVQDML